MNITLDEWRTEQLPKAADVVASTSPRMVVNNTGPNGFGFECDGCGSCVSVGVEQDWKHPFDAMVVDVRFGRVAAHGSTLVSARRHHTATRLLLEAAEAVAAMTEDLVIWMPGLCPCRTCGTKGVDSFTGKTCQTCDGVGKR